MKEKTSIVICAYNEEPTIEDVVSKCREYNPESELVVVDDGSQDKTEEILRSLNKELDFRYIRLDENQGKSNAMALGVQKAERDIILFFDADVSGIKKEHFEQLLSPLGDEADMVLGSPSETLIDYRVNPFKSLTGERALYKKDLEPILENIQDIRFGVETYMNLYFQAHGKKIKYTLLDGLTHPTKYDKTSADKATREFIDEGKEIAVTLLRNYDLITQRISNSFGEQGDSIKDSLKKLQKDLNEKIQVLLRNNG
ncbi:MAG TPA: glycosyltransferase family 2 protein [Salinivirga sp.]|uniref:glycosyltransferase family 2 protein n=1 Tax=Salinivirga sp. TaxID=1970192 RepID=UPI002B473D79|nr:glycosyltransferase family 2 protein [Salinivirga sp.]HKK60719.1 glycosyltransferase family 2 protein [Salinivirga sp.]